MVCCSPSGIRTEESPAGPPIRWAISRSGRDDHRHDQSRQSLSPPNTWTGCTSRRPATATSSSSRYWSLGGLDCASRWRRGLSRRDGDSEIPCDVRRVADTIRQRDARGCACCVVVVVEGPRPVGVHTSVLGTSPGQAERLGGAGPLVAGELDTLTKPETRAVVPGPVLRGGSPPTCERLWSLCCGGAAELSRKAQTASWWPSIRRWRRMRPSTTPAAACATCPWVPTRC